MRILSALAVMVGPAFLMPAFAQECPASADVSAELEALFAQAQAAEDFRQGQAASDAMWKVWLRAPDDAAQEVLERGMAARGSFDFIEAYAQFTRLTELHSLNVRLHMDDFGTGYSSLSYLHKLPIDTLKIDRSFVMDLGIRDEVHEIVKTIVTLAHNLKMQVVAEGVETPEQVTQWQ